MLSINVPRTAYTCTRRCCFIILLDCCCNCWPHSAGELFSAGSVFVFVVVVVVVDGGCGWVCCGDRKVVVARVKLLLLDLVC